SVRSGSRGSSRASAKARVSPLRWSNGRTGSSPASPESWPGDSSRTSGAPKKSRTCGQAGGILSGSLPGCRKDRSAHPLRRAGIRQTPQPTQGISGDYASQGPSGLVVPSMSEVTRILSAIEQGDPSAAAQLLPLVYDELRRLAAQHLA